MDLNTGDYHRLHNLASITHHGLKHRFVTPMSLGVLDPSDRTVFRETPNRLYYRHTILEFFALYGRDVAKDVIE